MLPIEMRRQNAARPSGQSTDEEGTDPTDDYVAVIAFPSIFLHPSLHVWGEMQFPRSFHVKFALIATFARD
jgi:hypothetical protein